MNKKKIITSLALILILSSCSNKAKTTKNPVSEETIAAALDDGKTEDESSDIDIKKDDSLNKNTDEKEIDYDRWRKMIVEIGDFSETLADNLSDDQLDDLITKAKKASKTTGYWAVKDFVFQQLSKMYPELSNKFPLDSVERKYYQEASKEGELTNKYEHERRLMADWGYDAGKVWTFQDKFIEDALNIAYLEDDQLYYEDYVKRAAQILFQEDKEEGDEETAEENDNTTKKTKKQAIRRFGSSQVDYDALKSTLVSYYEFAPSTVNQMTNEDIDLAYTKAMDRLEETGIGDIGLIFEELGKMFPGASTMYPGNKE